jgi:hypothetical protein
MHFVDFDDTVSILEFTPGTCPTDASEPRDLTAEDMMRRRLGKFCSDVCGEKDLTSESVSGVAEQRAMIASMQKLNENCTRTGTSCTFKDKVQWHWDSTGEYLAYLNGTNTNLPNANRKVIQRWHDDVKTLKADHDTKYHNNQLVMETDLGNSVEDKTIGRDVEEDMNTELQSSGSVGTVSQRTKGSTMTGDLLRRLRPRRKPRKPCESGALVDDHEALIFRMRST